jgi:maleylacetoacetate isomerase/maleylpyruvate isomerase
MVDVFCDMVGSPDGCDSFISFELNIFTYQNAKDASKHCHMKLYNYFRSSASFRVRIALHLKGLPFDYMAVHLPKGDHKKPDYAALAADQLVPMLDVHGDGNLQLSQSMAIMEYLDELHPTPALLPATPIGRASVRALAQSIACEIHPLNNLRVLQYLTRELKIDEAAKATWYRHWVRSGLESFERQLARVQSSTTGAFCFGDSPTMADCCLVPQIFNGQRFDTDFSGLPRTMAAFEACMQLEAFQRAAPANCPDAE